MKTCCKCGVPKDETEFRKVSANRDGLHTRCKTCVRAEDKIWRDAHPESCKRRNTENYENHRETRLEYAKTYYDENKEKIIERQVVYEREKEARNPSFKLHRRVRLLIRNGLFGRKTERTEALIGCSFEDLQKRFESLFLEGMNWKNYGCPKDGTRGWCIGHIKPRASFDGACKEQLKECWHFLNLRPEWSDTNLKNGANYEGIDFRGLRAEEWETKEIENREATEFIREHHYSKSCSVIITRAFGLFRKGSSTLFGVSVWMPPTLASAVSVCPDNPKAVLSLSRLALSPGCPKNTASYFLATCIRTLKSEKRWKFLVTYADTWKSHTGGIYRASNWTYVGETLPYPVWTKDGEMVSQRHGPVTHNYTVMREKGCVLEGKFTKHKFIFPL